ncbi:MAG TPA: hypothetical protein VM934_04515 [Pyrinomonadaceae bacterium]|jgi:hypothetical protein|nr:hypothetical protein [Pyrinomonadaceae bacterium]
MADPISGVAHGAISQNLGGEKMQQQGGAGGRSFESVLQKTQGEAAEAQAGAGAERTMSGAKLEEMRVDLMKRVGNLPPGASNVNALLPELIDSRTRLGMLRDVIGKSGNGTPVGTDLRGRFGQIENEWYQVEGIMKSNKDLSTTELLGLQARLYQVSQHVEVLSKVVDQVTGGIKTILNTNV